MTTIKPDLQSEIGRIPPELHSHFIEFLGSCIYGGLWVGEDSEIPNYHGLRKDAVDALKALEPPVIRWPGGCYADTYHWRDGIGPREKRPVTYNENFGTYEADSNQFGTHEFMELCRLVGARPWLNINLMSGTVAEMRDWMEYCNRKEGTTLSAERAQNGSKEPFRVELWGVGNEMWAGGGTSTPESYANEYRKYASAFPSFVSLDPADTDRPVMKRIASGPDGNKPLERVKWTKQFFQALGQFRQPPIDAMDLHFYNWNLDHGMHPETEFDEPEWDAVIHGCLELEEIIQEQAALIQEGLDQFPPQEGPEIFRGPRKTCDLVVGEWGNWHGGAFQNRPALYQQCTMRDAITTALTLDIFHRNCRLVRMACVAQTVNVLNSLILTEKDVCILTPNYDVFQMYKVHRNATALELKLEQADDKLYAFASRKDSQVYLNLVNTDMTREKEAVLELPGARCLSGSILASDDPHACNTADAPNRIRAKAAALPAQNGSRFQFTLPAASVHTYTFELSES
ncbi:MAG: alpha-L-arabinofuranosidase C-terminal domain-containing protein [Eubacteriales bacterium]|nr:alpha-L-arabinofuranosidase C-terminal domain-containing protein [Eubacteriales bacterium]